MRQGFEHSKPGSNSGTGDDSVLEISQKKRLVHSRSLDGLRKEHGFDLAKALFQEKISEIQTFSGRRIAENVASIEQLMSDMDKTISPHLNKENWQTLRDTVYQGLEDAGEKAIRATNEFLKTAKDFVEDKTNSDNERIQFVKNTISKRVEEIYHQLDKTASAYKSILQPFHSLSNIYQSIGAIEKTVSSHSESYIDREAWNTFRETINKEFEDAGKKAILATNEFLKTAEQDSQSTGQGETLTDTQREQNLRNRVEQQEESMRESHAQLDETVSFHSQILKSFQDNSNIYGLIITIDTAISSTPHQEDWNILRDTIYDGVENANGIFEGHKNEIYEESDDALQRAIQNKSPISDIMRKRRELVKTPCGQLDKALSTYKSILHSFKELSSTYQLISEISSDPNMEGWKTVRDTVYQGLEDAGKKAILATNEFLKPAEQDSQSTGQGEPLTDTQREQKLRDIIDQLDKTLFTYKSILYSFQGISIDYWFKSRLLRHSEHKRWKTVKDTVYQGFEDAGKEAILATNEFLKPAEQDSQSTGQGETLTDTQREQKSRDIIDQLNKTLSTYKSILHSFNKIYKLISTIDAAISSTPYQEDWKTLSDTIDEGLKKADEISEKADEEDVQRAIQNKAPTDSPQMPSAIMPERRERMKTSYDQLNKELSEYERILHFFKDLSSTYQLTSVIDRNIPIHLNNEDWQTVRDTVYQGLENPGKEAIRAINEFLKPAEQDSQSTGQGEPLTDTQREQKLRGIIGQLDETLSTYKEVLEPFHQLTLEKFTRPRQTQNPSGTTIEEILASEDPELRPGRSAFDKYRTKPGKE